MLKPCFGAPGLILADTVHAPDIVLLNNIQDYYVLGINIAYRRVHSLKFRGICQELSEI